MKTWTTTPAQLAVRLGAAACFVLTSQACDSLGKPAPAPQGPIRVAETDLRTPKKASTPPPPIQGGSLLALRDGATAVVGDPDRHRVLVVNITQGKVRFELGLEPAAQPGRLVEDARGHVHIVLRGSHELLQLDPNTGEEVSRRNVCGEPRGLAYNSADDALLLACADGTLWTFSATTGEVRGETFVARDLRDVVISGANIWVSTFRSAQVFRMASDGSVASSAALPKSTTPTFTQDGGFEERHRSAEAAWRMVASEGGSVTIVHQRAADDEIGIDPDTELHDAGVESDVFDQGGSSYGGGGGGFTPDGLEPPAGCEAIVTSAVTRVMPNGTTTSLPALGDAVLPVDVAVSDRTRLIAVISAGPRDEEAPRNKIVFPEFESPEFGSPDFPSPAPRMKSSVQVLSPTELTSNEPEFPFGASCTSSPVAEIPEPAISVAFVPAAQDGLTSNRLLVQTREPAKLYVIDLGEGGVDRKEIALGGASVADTGHDLFHRDSGGGIACASCHMEGTEDGHTWRFSGLGARRTQPLNVRLRGTQPFHWDGTLEDVGPLMEEVFVGRMGGAPQAEPRMEVLADWVLDLDPPAPIRADDDPAVKRGKKLFQSDEVLCSTCHSGPKFTNNESMDVGTSGGVPLQVPSLLGVGHRASLLHNGCAPTLLERFTPACGGGDKHGKTSQLSAAQIDDLIAYLDSL